MAKRKPAQKALAAYCRQRDAPQLPQHIQDDQQQKQQSGRRQMHRVVVVTDVDVDSHMGRVSVPVSPTGWYASKKIPGDDGADAGGENQGYFEQPEGGQHQARL